MIVLLVGIIATHPPAFAGGKWDVTIIFSPSPLISSPTVPFPIPIIYYSFPYPYYYYSPLYPECAGLYGPARQGCEAGAQDLRDELRWREYRRGYEFGRWGR